MAKTAKIDPDEKFSKQDFDLFEALAALDRKDYNWFSNLSEEQKRKFVPYMMLHWMSAVKAAPVMQSYYVLSCDSVANKHMFNEAVQKHPELQWLMLCAVSPGTGKQFHQWIPHLPVGVTQLRDKAKPKEVADYFKKIYPGADSNAVGEVAQAWTDEQCHKVRLAKMHPTLKIADIEVLCKLVSSADLDEYDRASGN